MLLLLFQVGSWRYAIEARKVINIVSPRSMRSSEQADQQAIVGFFQQVNGATMVSVIDLAQLLLGQPSPRNFGTRVMLMKDSHDRVWGLMASSMVETLTIDERLWQQADTQKNMSSSNPYVRQVLMQDQTLLHGLAIDQVFTQVNRHESERHSSNRFQSYN